MYPKNAAEVNLSRVQNLNDAIASAQQVQNGFESPEDTPRRSRRLPPLDYKALHKTGLRRKGKRGGESDEVAPRNIAASQTPPSDSL